MNSNKTNRNIFYTPEMNSANIRNLQRSDGETEIFLEDFDGTIHATSHSCFPGVAFVKKDIHLPQLISNWQYASDEAITVEYCMAGCLECQIGEETLRLSRGDIVISRTDSISRVLHYPENYYQAASIVAFPDCSSVLKMHFSMAGLEFGSLIQKYLSGNQLFCKLNRTDSISDIFKAMIRAPEKIKTAYYGVKILECFLILYVNDAIPAIAGSRKQEELTAKICQYVMAHTEKQFSVEELAAQFATSATSIQRAFKMVYGTSTQQYIREQKMLAAAKVLETQNIRITEVAQMFGYSNFSKFSAAFSSVTGENPKHYSMRLGAATVLKR